MTTKPKGVMIVGMEMPEKCAHCWFKNSRRGRTEMFWCCYVKSEPLSEDNIFVKRPLWCPLEEAK